MQWPRSGLRFLSAAKSGSDLAPDPLRGRAPGWSTSVAQAAQYLEVDHDEQQVQRGFHSQLLRGSGWVKWGQGKGPDPVDRSPPTWFSGG